MTKPKEKINHKFKNKNDYFEIVRSFSIADLIISIDNDGCRGAEKILESFMRKFLKFLPTYPYLNIVINKSMLDWLSKQPDSIIDFLVDEDYIGEEEIYFHS